MMVVLPAPFLPNRPYIFPVSMEKLIVSTTVRSPYVFVKRSTSTTLLITFSLPSESSVSIALPRFPTFLPPGSLSQHIAQKIAHAAFLAISHANLLRQTSQLRVFCTKCTDPPGD